MSRNNITKGEMLIALAIALAVLFLVTLPAAAGAGREVRYVSLYELDDLLADPDMGWEYGGWRQTWLNRTEYRVERNTMQRELLLIEIALLNGCEMQGSGFWVDAETLDEFNGRIERAARRAGKEGR